MLTDSISIVLRRPATRQWLVAICLVLAAAPVWAQAAFNPFDWICAALDIIKGPLAAAGFLIAAAVFLILLMAGEHNRGVSTFLIIGLCVTALVGVDQLGRTFWPRLSFIC